MMSSRLYVMTQCLPFFSWLLTQLLTLAVEFLTKENVRRTECDCFVRLAPRRIMTMYFPVRSPVLP